MNTIDPRTIRDREIGKKLLAAYVRIAKLNKVEAVQDYTITDAITALLHYAGARGFDAPELNRCVSGHFETETTVCEECGHVGDPDDHDCAELVTEFCECGRKPEECVYTLENATHGDRR